MRATPERDLHLAVVDLLDRTAMPGVLYWHTNNTVSNVRYAKMLKRLGVKPGVADLVIMSPTRRPPIAFLELKAPGGRQSDEQVEFGFAVRCMGCRYEIARSLEEAAEYLADFGAIRPVVSGRADVRRRVA